MPKASWRRCVISTGRLPLRWISPTGILGLVVVTADHETGGLSIPSADVDFEHEEAGIEYRFSTGGHTAAMVPSICTGQAPNGLTAYWTTRSLARMLKWLVLPDSGRIANVPD